MTTKIPVELSSTPSIVDNGDATAITIDSSENITLTGDISLADSKKVNIGAGNDLQIYHNGSHSFIKEAGTGGLYMPTSAVYMRNAADSAGVAYFVDGGAVTLYHDGTSKFATSSNGGIMYGGITFNGDTATANLLDDYEEGTYTPTSGASLTVTYAKYTKIGRLVYLNADITVGTTAGNSAFAMSLPFDGVDAYYSGLVQYNNVPEPQLAVNITTTQLHFRKLDSSFGFLNYTSVSGHRFIFSIVYTSAT